MNDSVTSPEMMRSVWSCCLFRRRNAPVFNASEESLVTLGKTHEPQIDYASVSGVTVGETVYETERKPMYRLTVIQRERLAELHNNNALKGLILLVDDQSNVLKMLVRSLMRLIFKGQVNRLPRAELNGVQPSDWADYGVTMDVFGEWGVICAANGLIAAEILRQSPRIKSVVSDFEMPMMDGIDLIYAIREFEASQQNRDPVRILLNTSIKQDKLHSRIDFGQQAVAYLEKGTAPEKLNQWMAEIILEDQIIMALG